jgi:signal transduction histidine kinase
MLDKPAVVSDFEADIAAIRGIEAIPKILEVVCRTTGMGFAAVARVTESRWVTCGVRDEIAFGLQPGDELKVETTLCHEIRESREPIVIEDVAKDEIYCRHNTPAMYGFQSYISMPIILPDGTFFGTLCAIDPKPARLKTPETIGMFKLFAELIAFHLAAHNKLASSEARLLDERKTAELREQFIAVLGHDLRNPLASIDAGLRMLQRTPLDEKAIHIVGVMKNSITRIAGLIDDVLDFARGRLGGGLLLNRDADRPVEPVLSQVVAELRAAWPNRAIDARFALTHPIKCDRARVAQLFSNLLGNALSYGAADAPVRVTARTDGASFELSVANSGEEIPSSTIERLFLPFSRGAVRPSQQGLGLGLYIASEIARAHGGRIDVASSPEETLFTFRMPLG